MLQRNATPGTTRPSVFSPCVSYTSSTPTKASRLGRSATNLASLRRLATGTCINNGPDPESSRTHAAVLGTLAEPHRLLDKHHPETSGRHSIDLGVSRPSCLRVSLTLSLSGFAKPRQDSRRNLPVEVELLEGLRVAVRSRTHIYLLCLQKPHTMF